MKFQYPFKEKVSIILWFYWWYRDNDRNIAVLTCGLFSWMLLYRDNKHTKISTAINQSCEELFQKTKRALMLLQCKQTTITELKTTET